MASCIEIQRKRGLCREQINRSKSPVISKAKSMATLIRPIVAEPDPDGSEERERTKHLAQRYRCEFIDLREQRVDPELMRSIPAELMFRYTFVPLEAHNGSIAVALSDPSRLAMT